MWPFRDHTLPLLRGIPLISWQRGLFHRGKKNRSVFAFERREVVSRRRSGVRTVLYFFNGSIRITLSLTIKSVWKQRFRRTGYSVALWVIETVFPLLLFRSIEKPIVKKILLWMKHYYTCILTNLFVIKHVKNTFDSFCPPLMDCIELIYCHFKILKRSCKTSGLSRTTIVLKFHFLENKRQMEFIYSCTFIQNSVTRKNNNEKEGRKKIKIWYLSTYLIPPQSPTGIHKLAEPSRANANDYTVRDEYM